MTRQQITNSIKNRAKKIYKWCSNNLGTIIVVAAGVFMTAVVYLKSISKKEQAKTAKQETQPKPVVHVHEHKEVENKLMLTSFWQRMYHWSNAKYSLNPDAPKIATPIVKQETTTLVGLEEEEDDGAGVYPKHLQQAKKDLSSRAPRLKL